MKIVLYDGPAHTSLRPLTFCCPVAHLRLGIRTLAQKWEACAGREIDGYHPEPYLIEAYGLAFEEEEDTLFIAGDVIAHPALWEQLRGLRPGQRLVFDNQTIGYCAGAPLQESDWEALESVGCYTEVQRLRYPWDFFRMNGDAIEADLAMSMLHQDGDRPQSHPNIQVRGSYPVVVHPTACIESAVLNATEGSIYIGPNAHVMEGAIVRGPFALCEHATLKMGARIYGKTTVGPHCKAGGELNNVLMNSYSNKGHDGFLGNAVIGSWCNLGADTNNSNLKNNYAPVRMWSYPEGDYVDTGMQFCGLVMGDHAKTAINTMLNTGTVVGVAANIFGSGFPPRFIPSFSWGGADRLEEHRLEQALQTASRMMQRRGLHLDNAQRHIMEQVFHLERGMITSN